MKANVDSMSSEKACSKSFAISFIVPVRKDPRVSQCVNQLRAYMASESLNAEILICGEQEDWKSANDAKFVRVVPADKGRCIRQGVLASTGDIVIVCDADFPVLPCDITSLRNKMMCADVALGNRCLPESEFIVIPPCYRRFASIAFRSVVGALFKMRGFDTQCGIKAFARSVALALFENEVATSFAFDVQILLRARRKQMRIVQVPVHWKSSVASTVNVWRSVPSVVADLLRFWVDYKLRDISA